MLVLALLIVANLALLFLLFRPDRALIAQPADRDPGDGSSPTATSSPSPDLSTDPTRSTRSIESVPVERLLFAASSKTAWRATVGDCNTPGKIERSTNGGASWKAIVGTGPAPIVTLGAEPSGDLFTIGGRHGSCAVRYAAYASDGTLTASATSVDGMWFPSPSDWDEINGPSGTKATPCNGHVVGLAPFNLTQALVVCDNGDAINTHNSGETWRRARRIPNTLAVAAGSGRYWVAGVREDCHGVAVQSLTDKNGSLTRGRARCAPDLDVAGGQVAMDVADGTIWLWSGNRTAISTDNGDTWK
jgi:hypothetical protein